jgi:hypothetical protein
MGGDLSLHKNQPEIAVRCFLTCLPLGRMPDQILSPSFLKISPPYKSSIGNKHIESGILVCYSNRRFLRGHDLGKKSSPLGVRDIPQARPQVPLTFKTPYLYTKTAQTQVLVNFNCDAWHDDRGLGYHSIYCTVKF